MLLIQQVSSGLATGAVYACMGLSVVIIYQAIDHVNFAQGEMAMFSTFIAWQLLQWGVPYPLAFLATVALSFALGFLLQQIVFAPLQRAPVLAHIVVFIALFAIFNSAAGFIWGHEIKEFPSPFGFIAGSRYIDAHAIGMIGITILILLALYGFFRGTRLGLAMRAAAGNPASARLVGIHVGRMIALGWGMASAMGAVAGMLVAPVVFLEPNMMVSILVYGFAGAVLGGLSSPGGAVFGGFTVGILENLAATYIPVVGEQMKLTVALALIVGVLVVKPSGLFSRRQMVRV